jgi:hypothetical protein
MRRVYMRPSVETSKTNTVISIHQVVLQLARWLPRFGWQVVDDLASADVVANHAGQFNHADPSHNKPTVAHSFGLYPTGERGGETFWPGANNAVIEDLRRADIISAPSQWVADLIARSMRIEPRVIGYAIDAEDWYPKHNPQMSAPYVLWNKTRPDVICDPTPVITLARAYPQQQFVTTFIPSGVECPSNVRVIGRTSREEMAVWVRGAAVLLATTKETFGIATLEAMASGVPVLSWHHGATVDLVAHGITGYLAQVSNNDDLIAGLAYCLQHRDRLGASSALEARRPCYTWEHVAKQIAALYDEAARPCEYTSAIIIPAHNYGRYLREAVTSACTQVTRAENMVVVVDDKSSDDTQAVCAELKKKFRKLVVLTMPENVGVAAARNAGIKYADVKYIACLDADDRLIGNDWLQRHIDAMEADSSVGIAYGGLHLMNEAGVLHDGGLDAWPPRTFSWHAWQAMKQGTNQIPTCCVFRKRWWAAVGGYIGEYLWGEDGNLWLRMIAAGARVKSLNENAVKGQEMAFAYRRHNQSLTASMRSELSPVWSEYGWDHAGQPFASPHPQHHMQTHSVYNTDAPLVRVLRADAEDDDQQLSVFELDRLWAQEDPRWAVYDAPVGATREALILAIEGKLQYQEMPPDALKRMIENMARSVDHAPMMITYASGSRLILMKTPDYYAWKGITAMCGCGSVAKQTSEQEAAAELVRIRYMGGNKAPIAVYGEITGRFYGMRVDGDYFMVDARDQRGNGGLFALAPLDNLIPVPLKPELPTNVSL